MFFNEKTKVSPDIQHFPNGNGHTIFLIGRGNGHTAVSFPFLKLLVIF